MRRGLRTFNGEALGDHCSHDFSIEGHSDEIAILECCDVGNGQWSLLPAGGPGGARTHDRAIMSRLLSPLSYRPR